MLAAEVARCLARDAERVCRHYLPAGRRRGAYWTIGDAAGTAGSSLYVRLRGPDQGKGAAGKWTDAATGEHGDLLDLLAAARRLTSLRETLDEARSFLSLPPATPDRRMSSSTDDLVTVARRLFATSRPLPRTLADVYLRQRGITGMRNEPSLRFHPCCSYRPTDDDAPDTPTAWPALVAAITDLGGTITGVHRTWLDSSTKTKAPVDTPRRAMGQLAGHGVRFGVADDVMAAGEGIETVLSLRTICPDLPAVAALSASHLAALRLPSTLRRLYIVEDRDRTGRAAADRLAMKARSLGVEVQTLRPTLGDLNDDLAAFGRRHLASHLRLQFVAEDARYIVSRR